MPTWRVLPLSDGDDPKKGVRVIRQAWAGEPFLAGVVIDVAEQSGSGDFTIEHGLGRVPSGFVIEWMERAAAGTGAASIYYRTGATRDAGRLVLYTSAAFTTARIRVF